MRVSDSTFHIWNSWVDTELQVIIVAHIYECRHMWMGTWLVPWGCMKLVRSQTLMLGCDFKLKIHIVMRPFCCFNQERLRVLMGFSRCSFSIVSYISTASFTACVQLECSTYGKCTCPILVGHAGKIKMWQLRGIFLFSTLCDGAPTINCHVTSRKFDYIP